jgi:MFS family permease
MIIDKVGYKNSLYFAFFCHILSAVLTFFAQGYGMLFVATFIMAIGNGAAESAINPVTITLFPNNNTKYLNYLHAGWPVGLILGGILVLIMGPEVAWRFKMLLVVLPAVTYAILMFPLLFPIQQRVKAGVPYIKMLKELGVGGAFMITVLIVFQLGVVLGWSTTVNLIITLALTASFGIFVHSFGQPVFILILLFMIPLATTELGTDGWISDLMAPAMSKIGLQAGWILVYTSAIMAIMRFSIGKFVHKIKPLGILVICSAIASLGLFLLSTSAGIMVLVAATVYGLGKSLLWPTVLGVVADRFPKGGALTLNATTGVGMIGGGIIGAVILGFIQDKTIDSNIIAYDRANNSALHSTYIAAEKTSIFGNYQALDLDKLSLADETDRKIVTEIQGVAKKDALKKVAIFPFLMMICWMLLMFYYKLKGGYKKVLLE